MVKTPTPLKNDGVKVSWDDENPKIWKQHVPNHQADILLFQLVTIINHRLTIANHRLTMD